MTVVPSNAKNIAHAVMQIGLAIGSVVDGEPTPFLGSKLYAGPTQEQIEETGTPYLAVVRPVLGGYAPGGSPGSMDEERGVQITEPVWDIEVYCFHPYDANFPNYDDAWDDANNFWTTFMELPTLHYGTTVVSSVGNTLTVAPGDGRRFKTFEEFFVGNYSIGVVASIAGDTLTFGDTLPFQPSPGTAASQATCANSYPTAFTADYVELINGGPWIAGYISIRAFETLMTQFP